MLVNSKYKLDTEIYSEQEVQLSRLQLKVDAQKARESISEIRETYRAPQKQEAAEETSFVDDEWLADMRRETSALTGLEFDLGNGNSFQFGLDDNYRNQLIQKNSQLEDYFDPYVREDGSWDYDKLNSHRAVVDNIDKIVANAYRQGISDGQKNVVSKVANSSVQSPQTNPNQNPVDPVNDQLKNIMSNVGSGLSFNPRI
jgi:DNA-binding transcriptional MerR regulator